MTKRSAICLGLALAVLPLLGECNNKPSAPLGSLPKPDIQTSPIAETTVIVQPNRASAPITPQLLWMRYLGIDTYLNPPLAAHGLVYFAGLDDGRPTVVALDAHTGNQKWVSKLDAYGGAESPTITDDLMIFSTYGWLNYRDEFSKNAGRLFAVDLLTGEQRWHLESEDEFLLAAAADHIVYVGSSRLWSGTGNPPSVPHGGISARDAATGEFKWEIPVLDAGVSLVTYHEGVLYYLDTVATGGNYIHALDLQTRQDKWKTDFRRGNKVIVSGPLVANGIVYHMGDYHHVYALDAQSGKLKWHFDTGVNIPDADVIGIASVDPVTDGANVYLAMVEEFDSTGSHSDCFQFCIVALEAGTGREKWRHKSFLSPGQGVASLGIAGDSVVVGTYQSNFLYAIDRKSGQINWTFEADNGRTGAYLSDKGMLYLTDARENVYALRLPEESTK